MASWGPPMRKLLCQEAFARLSEDERKYVFQLSSAAWKCARVVLEQASPESLQIAVLLHWACEDKAYEKVKAEGAITEEELSQFYEYLARFWANLGNYDAITGAKIIPRLGPEAFEKVLIRHSFLNRLRRQHILSLFEEVKGAMYAPDEELDEPVGSGLSSDEVVIQQVEKALWEATGSAPDGAAREALEDVLAQFSGKQEAAKKDDEEDSVPTEQDSPRPPPPGRSVEVATGCNRRHLDWRGLRGALLGLVAVRLDPTRQEAVSLHTLADSAEELLAEELPWPEAFDVRAVLRRPELVAVDAMTLLPLSMTSPTGLSPSSGVPASSSSSTAYGGLDRRPRALVCTNAVSLPGAGLCVPWANGAVPIGDKPQRLSEEAEALPFLASASAAALVKQVGARAAAAVAAFETLARASFPPWPPPSPANGEVAEAEKRPGVCVALETLRVAATGLLLLVGGSGEVGCATCGGTGGSGEHTEVTPPPAPGEGSKALEVFGVSSAEERIQVAHCALLQAACAGLDALGRSSKWDGEALSWPRIAHDDFVRFAILLTISTPDEGLVDIADGDGGEVKVGISASRGAAAAAAPLRRLLSALHAIREKMDLDEADRLLYDLTHLKGDEWKARHGAAQKFARVPPAFVQAHLELTAEGKVQMKDFVPSVRGLISSIQYNLGKDLDAAAKACLLRQKEQPFATGSGGVHDAQGPVPSLSQSEKSAGEARGRMQEPRPPSPGSDGDHDAKAARSSAGKDARSQIDAWIRPRHSSPRSGRRHDTKGSVSFAGKGAKAAWRAEGGEDAADDGSGEDDMQGRWRPSPSPERRGGKDKGGKDKGCKGCLGSKGGGWRAYPAGAEPDFYSKIDKRSKGDGKKGPLGGGYAEASSASHRHQEQASPESGRAGKGAGTEWLADDGAWASGKGGKQPPADVLHFESRKGSDEGHQSVGSYSLEKDGAWTYTWRRLGEGKASFKHPQDNEDDGEDEGGAWATTWKRTSEGKGKGKSGTWTGKDAHWMAVSDLCAWEQPTGRTSARARARGLEEPPPSVTFWALGKSHRKGSGKEWLSDAVGRPGPPPDRDGDAAPTRGGASGSKGGGKDAPARRSPPTTFVPTPPPSIFAHSRMCDSGAAGVKGDPQRAASRSASAKRSASAMRRDRSGSLKRPSGLRKGPPRSIPPADRSLAEREWLAHAPAEDSEHEEPWERQPEQPRQSHRPQQSEAWQPQLPQHRSESQQPSQQVKQRPKPSPPLPRKPDQLPPSPKQPPLPHPAQQPQAARPPPPPVPQPSPAPPQPAPKAPPRKEAQFPGQAQQQHRSPPQQVQQHTQPQPQQQHHQPQHQQQQPWHPQQQHRVPDRHARGETSPAVHMPTFDVQPSTSWLSFQPGGGFGFEAGRRHPLAGSHEPFCAITPAHSAFCAAVGNRTPMYALDPPMAWMPTSYETTFAQQMLRLPPRLQQIGDLRPEMYGINLLVRCVRVFPLLQPSREADVLVGDRTGIILLRCRSEDVTAFQQGCPCKICNALIAMVQGHMRLEVVYEGWVEACPTAPSFEVYLPNDMSYPEYELVDDD